MNNKIVNETLLDFWNQSIKITKEDKQALLMEKDLSYKDLIPSMKLESAISELKGCQKVLDYGCGNAWASIASIKNGVKHVDAVDIGDNIIETAQFYIELFDVQSNIEVKSISPLWLSRVPTNTYDGVICSNVLDVVPLETGDEIIKDLSNVLIKDAKAIIGLNFYLSEDIIKTRKMELKENCLFVDGVLRLLNLSDEQWKKRFEPYFEVEKFTYFSWPSENKETRRLFILKKK